MAVDTTIYKEKLETELTELTAELKTIGIQNPENPADWIESGTDLDTEAADPNEVADRTEEWDERRATVATLENRYNNIRHALERIEAGTYGICEVCAGAIESDRLDANPAARTCKAHMEEEANLPR